MLFYARREGRRAALRLRVRAAATGAAALLVGQTAHVTKSLAARRDAERDRVLECREALDGSYRPVGRLVGRCDESLVRALVAFIVRRLARLGAGRAQ